jgi:hypothetical protein
MALQDASAAKAIQVSIAARRASDEIHGLAPQINREALPLLSMQAEQHARPTGARSGMTPTACAKGTRTRRAQRYSIKKLKYECSAVVMCLSNRSLEKTSPFGGAHL